MTRYVVALLLAGLVHTAAFWGWCTYRRAHPENLELPTIDLSSVELSFSDNAESENIQAVESRPVDSHPPPAERASDLRVPPTEVPQVSPIKPEHASTRNIETPPDVLMVPDGLPLPVASPPPSTQKPQQPQESEEAVKPEPLPEPAPTSAAVPAPARETAQIQTPPAPPTLFRPRYPTGSRKRGEEGVVTLEIDVNELGRATGVRVLSSSGFAELDAAAVSAANKARFNPATEDDKPIPGRLRLPVAFKLR